MFRPGWYSNSNRPYYEYFISEEGWTISTREKVFINKFYDMRSFERVEDMKIATELSRELIINLFAFGWEEKLFFDVSIEDIL